MILIGSSSCGKVSFQNTKELLSWIEDEGNGLVQTKYVNGIKLKLKYLPPLYLVKKDNPKANKIQIDSLTTLRKKYYTFLLTLGTDERKEQGQDIVFKNIQNFQQYQERIYDMNFRMKEIISIETEAGSYFPVLTNFENNYGLKNERDFVVVFSARNKNDHTLEQLRTFDVLYNDIFFDTGRSYFVFKKKNIERANNIEFNENN